MGSGCYPFKVSKECWDQHSRNLLKILNVGLWGFSSEFSQPVFSEGPAPLSMNLIPPLILHHLLGFFGTGRSFLSGYLSSHILTVDISLLWKDFILLWIPCFLVMFLWNNKCLLPLVMSEVMLLKYSNSSIYQWQRGRTSFSYGARSWASWLRSRFQTSPTPLWHLSHECPSIHPRLKLLCTPSDPFSH